MDDIPLVWQGIQHDIIETGISILLIRTSRNLGKKLENSSKIAKVKKNPHLHQVRPRRALTLGMPKRTSILGIGFKSDLAGVPLVTL